MNETVRILFLVELTLPFVAFVLVLIWLFTTSLSMPWDRSAGFRRGWLLPISKALSTWLGLSVLMLLLWALVLMSAYGGHGEHADGIVFWLMHTTLVLAYVAGGVFLVMRWNRRRRSVVNGKTSERTANTPT